MKPGPSRILRPFGLFTLPGVLDALLFWSLFASASTLMLWLLTSTIKTTLRETIIGHIYGLTVTVGEMAVSELSADSVAAGDASLRALRPHLQRVVERNPELIGLAIVEYTPSGPRPLVVAPEEARQWIPTGEARFRDWLETSARLGYPYFSDWAFIEDTALPLFTRVVTEPEFAFLGIRRSGAHAAQDRVVVLVFNAPLIQEKFLEVDRIAATVIALAIIIATLLSLFVRRRSMQRQEAIGEKLAVLGLLGRRDAILAGVASAADRLVGEKDPEPAISDLMGRIREVLAVRDAYTCLSPQAGGAPGVDRPTAVLGARPGRGTLEWNDLERPELAVWKSRFLGLQPVAGPLDGLSAVEQEFLRGRGISNLAVVPVLFESSLVGFMVVEEDDRERNWEPGLLDTLRLAGDLIGAALARREHDQRLMETGKMQAMGRMAAGVAHEFNNLLHIISGNLRVLTTRGLVGRDGHDLVGKIVETTERGGRIVEQLLSATRHGRAELRPASLNEVVQKTVFLAQSALRKDVRLVVTLDPKLPQARMDPTQIQQVILNLLINAQDAIDGPGEVVVATGSVAQGQGGRNGCHVYCVVQDSGSGIAANDLDHLFDPFFTTKAPGKGTGLGLSTSRGILEQHQGLIVARNLDPKGASFTFYIPAIEGSVEESGPAARPADGTPLPELPPGVVLVADDEPMCRNVLRATFEEMGFRCHEATGGVHALELAERERAHLDWVVTDWSMPGLHGRELILGLRKILPHIPILVTSGFVLDPGELKEADGVVMKPFNPAVLVRRMTEIREQRKAEPRVDR